MESPIVTIIILRTVGFLSLLIKIKSINPRLWKLLLQQKKWQEAMAGRRQGNCSHSPKHQELGPAQN